MPKLKIEKKVYALPWLTPFKAGKHKMILPEIDSIAVSIVYKGKMYGGFVKAKFEDDIYTERTLNFIIKTAKNQINRLRISNA